MAATLEAIGPMSEPKEKLVRLVAESQTWQDWCGVVTPEAARARIFRNRAVFLNHALERPYAIASWTDDFEYREASGGSKVWLLPAGTLWLYLTDRYRHPDSENNLLEFENRVGQVLADLAALAGVDDHLAVRNIKTDTPPQDAGMAAELLAGEAAAYLEASYFLSYSVGE